MKTAGPLQKLLHLANAREALASGDLQLALGEADAAVAADATFAAALTLRADILARMNNVVVASANEVAVAAPVVAVAAGPATTGIEHDPGSVRPSSTASSGSAGAPAAGAVPVRRPRRAPGSERIAVAITLGLLVIVGGVVAALFAGGILTRAPGASRSASLAPTASQQTANIPARPASSPAVTAPAPVHTAAPAAPARATSGEPPSAASNGVEWASARLTRLSVRPRWRASAMHVEDAALLKDLGEGISELWVGKLPANVDAIFVGGSVDDIEWPKLRASIKPTGVVWRIYSSRGAAATDTTAAGRAAAAGFARVKRVRYSPDYVAEQFAPRGAVK